MTNPSIAVVGGGINGCGIAWELARRDYRVTLFEKNTVGSATSSATTKMVHGGLRYLETFQLALVRESLRERAFLLERVPDLVRPLRLVIPHYARSSRSRIAIEIGLTLYDILAGRRRIERHGHLKLGDVALAPLRVEGLRAGFVYSDAQVDDHELVRRVAASAAHDGATVREQTPVRSIRRGGDGWLIAAGDRHEAPFDIAVIVAGPWMNQLLANNRIATRYLLTLVRGSHIVLRRRVSDHGFLLESPGEKRVLFVLPWKEGTLVGTTEVMHREPLDSVRASDEEVSYLIERFNGYFKEPIARDDIARTFAGVRALVGTKSDLSSISREYRIEVEDRLVNVFGGKLTTFMSLARNVAARVDRLVGIDRTARPPLFYNPVA